MTRLERSFDAPAPGTRLDDRKIAVEALSADDLLQEDIRSALDDALGYIDRLQHENVHLTGVIARFRDGVTNASNAGLDTLYERARQRRMEGYDDEHDDEHNDFSLSAAAIAYVLDARLRGTTGHGFDDGPPIEWPWMRADWKPKDVRRSLVVAAALLIAEVERIDRAVEAI